MSSSGSPDDGLPTNPYGVSDETLDTIRENRIEIKKVAESDNPANWIAEGLLELADRCE